MAMIERKLQLKCGMRGCGNTISHTFTKNGEFGVSVVLCEDCLKEAYELVFPAKKAEKSAETQAEKVEEKTEPIKREPAHRTTTTRSRGR